MNIGKRLRIARERLGYSVTKASEVSGIGSSSISEFENGRREPRMSHLRKFADIYSKPTSFFLEEEDPQEVTIRWRLKPEEAVAYQIESKLLKLCEQFFRLEVWTQNTKACSISPESIDPSRFSYTQAQALAMQFREKHGLGRKPGGRLMEFLEEECGVKIFHVDLGLTGSAACTLSPEFGVAIFLSKGNRPWRRNFDLGHELFHILTWPHELPEKLATCFARNLLMPEEEFRLQAPEELFIGEGRVDGIFSVARLFAVSADSVVWQSSFVLGIAEEQCSKLISKFSGNSWVFETREFSDPPNKPARFLSLARQALSQGNISLSRFAEVCGIGRKEALKIQEGIHDTLHRGNCS